MKIAIYTLGCKVNQYESDSLGFSLLNNGNEVFYDLVFADIFIINTCAVTNEAEKKSRQVIAKIKRINPYAKIFICGCASQKNPKNFLKSKNVVFVSGVANKLKIVDMIEKNFDVCVDIDKIPKSYNENYISKPTRTRAYVKIQDGCNNFCSYCIIPYLRGRSRSRNVIEILNEVKRIQGEVKEVVLTGINLSDFRIDGKLSLGKLIKLLANNEVRIRLGSLEQGIIDEKFIDDISNVNNLCPHFHLSLQSGSLSILKRMNRHYTPNEFEEKVRMLRKIFINPAITTDIIVGFPGETEEEFYETVKFVKKIGFSSIHIFPYSKREGTVAAKMRDINGEIKKTRVNVLEKVKNELEKNYIKTSKKNEHSVLIEEKQGCYYIGHAENYIKCYIKAKNLMTNSLVNVKIKKIFKDGALAKLIN